MERQVPSGLNVYGQWCLIPDPHHWDLLALGAQCSPPHAFWGSTSVKLNFCLLQLEAAFPINIHSRMSRVPFSQQAPQGTEILEAQSQKILPELSDRCHCSPGSKLPSRDHPHIGRPHTLPKKPQSATSLGVTAPPGSLSHRVAQ